MSRSARIGFVEAAEEMGYEVTLSGEKYTLCHPEVTVPFIITTAKLRDTGQRKSAIGRLKKHHRQGIAASDHVKEALESFSESKPSAHEELMALPKRLKNESTKTGTFGLIEDSLKAEIEFLPEPTIVNEEPYKAKRSMTDDGGLVYDSSATIKREWSDGTIDYACSTPECDYTSANARSVSSHSGKAHGAKERTGSDYVDPSIIWEPNGQQSSSITRLLNELKAAREAGHITDEDAAKYIVEHRVRESGGGRGEMVIKPMTDSEMLANITLMLQANGRLPDSNKVTELEAKLAEAEERAAAAEKAMVEDNAKLAQSEANRVSLEAELQTSKSENSLLTSANEGLTSRIEELDALFDMAKGVTQAKD